MDIREHVPLGPKTTMRIGGTARWYGEAVTTEDVEQACTFAKAKSVPLIVLGGGSNTVFADGEIHALVIRIKASATHVDGNIVTVDAGKSLAMLINELAEQGLDLSALTGIPGTVGGAVFGNAGQGHGGIWVDSFLESVTVFADGAWHDLSKAECDFSYRESSLKNNYQLSIINYQLPPVIWSATLVIPKGDPTAIKANIEALLKRRIETQPHLKTAGSCFKSLPDGTPAWKRIDAAGLRGYRAGDIQVSEKHANFLLNVGNGTFHDLRAVVDRIRKDVPDIPGIEMRLFRNDGTIAA